MSYKRFLFTGEKIPRSTAYRRKQREKNITKQQLVLALSAENNDSSNPKNPFSSQTGVSNSPEESEISQESNTDRNFVENRICTTVRENMKEGAGKILDVNETQPTDNNDTMLSSDFQPEKPATFFPETDHSQASSVRVENSFVENNSTSKEGSQAGLTPANSSTLKNDNNLLSDVITPERRKSPRLCPCTECSAEDVMLMCLSLGFRHNLTWDAQVDILKMINAIYGTTKIQASKPSYLKNFQKENLDISYHFQCTNCNVYLGKRKDATTAEYCEECETEVDVSHPTNYFVSVSLKSQLQKLFENSYVASEVLTHRFKLKDNIEAFEDIYDGKGYQKYVKAGILSNPYNISYCFFTDGVAMGSTNKSIWPLYIAINELPIKDRSKFILLAGLYVGSSEPDQNVFLKPFVAEANQLSQEGFSWVHNGRPVISKALPLCLIADSVARYHLMNMKSFHAAYGCTFCYQKTQRTKRRLKYTLPVTKAEERTVDSFMSDVSEAIKKQDNPRIEDRHHRGVKGPTVLMALNHFSIASGVVVDYMHCILLGVIKTHIELILMPERKKFWHHFNEERYAIDDLCSVIDSRLLHIQPPTTITRIPRSIKERKRWKANEWRAWLLFYVIPCLQGILVEKYLCHLAMLSKATNILLQKSITRKDVEEAHRLFCSYMFYYQTFFGEEYMFYNIHLLSHITKGVILWGPKWTHNAFMYESQNRHLLQLYKSPFQVAAQIARKYVIYKSLPVCCTTMSSTDLSIEFCEEVLERPLKRYFRSGGTILLGKGTRSDLTTSEEHCVSNYCNCDVSEVKKFLVFQRMICNGIRISSLAFSVGKQSNDSYVCVRGQPPLVIQSILLTPHGHVVLLAQTLQLRKSRVLQNEYVKVDHIQLMKHYGDFLCIAPKAVKSHCITMPVKNNDEIYICEIPYGCQGD